MSRLKKIGKVLLVILLIANVLLIVSGNSFIYKALANTYLKGRTSAGIEDYLVFDNRTVEASTPQDWPISKDYNTMSLNDGFREKFEHYQTVSFLVIKKDSILYEEYWDNYGKESVSNSFSMSKSIVSMLIGSAIMDGYIESVDQYVGDFIPSFKEGDKSKITIEHLLTMSSGIDFNESYKSPFSYTAEAYFGDDLEELTLSYPATEEPGKVWKYLSGNTQLLALVLKAATGKHVSNYASEKLWKPMGASADALWCLDEKEGVEKAYCCFNSNAQDFARFGKLYLDSGRWNGTQLVPTDYVLQSTIPADLVDKHGNKNTKYGYQWWLMPDYKGYNVFLMRGILGQYVICIPSQHLIIVRLGHKRGELNHEKGFTEDVYHYIDAGLQIGN